LLRFFPSMYPTARRCEGMAIGAWGSCRVCKNGAPLTSFDKPISSSDVRIYRLKFFSAEAKRFSARFRSNSPIKHGVPSLAHVHGSYIPQHVFRGRLPLGTGVRTSWRPAPGPGSAVGQLEDRGRTQIRVHLDCRRLHRMRALLACSTHQKWQYHPIRTGRGRRPRPLPASPCYAVGPPYIRQAPAAIERAHALAGPDHYCAPATGDNKTRPHSRPGMPGGCLGCTSWVCGGFRPGLYAERAAPVYAV
jgi:hypothetical protein